VELKLRVVARRYGVRNQELDLRRRELDGQVHRRERIRQIVVARTGEERRRAGQR
jgi:hypothetical protein